MKWNSNSLIRDKTVLHVIEARVGESARVQFFKNPSHTTVSQALCACVCVCACLQVFFHRIARQAQSSIFFLETRLLNPT